MQRRNNLYRISTLGLTETELRTQIFTNDNGTVQRAVKQVAAKIDEKFPKFSCNPFCDRSARLLALRRVRTEWPKTGVPG